MDTDRAGLTEAEALELLQHGEMELEGRLVDASNTTLRAEITYDGVTARCVYKPIRGERPLWDFPDGTLAGREVSAYLVGAATGWFTVPPTVMRDHGPLGPGACQLWIDEVDEDALAGFVPSRRVPAGWKRIARAEDDDGRPYVLAHADDERLARLAAFDAVINNADRKGGHLLVTAAGAVFGVDHGISFHEEDKLRTILWGWAGLPLPADTLEVLGKLRADLEGELGEALAEHLTIREVGRVGVRLDRLIDGGCYPQPPDDRHAMPWPPI